MSKTVFLMATTAALALALAACKPPTPRHKARPEASGVVTSLDCPARQGGLERVSVAADGRSCAYSDQKGARGHDGFSTQTINCSAGNEAERGVSIIQDTDKRSDTDGGDLERFGQLWKHDPRRRAEHILIEVIKCCQ